MYYQNYEDYMRSILGYPVQNTINYNDTYNNTSTRYEYITNKPNYSNEILELYPEIYKIINPMVCKICESNSKPITKELIEQMTDEIYLNFESDTTIENDVVNVRVNLPQSKSESNENKQNLRNSNNLSNNVSRKNRDIPKDNISKNRIEEKENKESLQRTESRQIRRNNTLRDLIKILILNQLLGNGRPPFRPPRPNPPRPPYPGGPGPNPRPPFPGGPGQNPRPPIMPRDINSNLI